jgi:hypothetical protein
VAEHKKQHFVAESYLKAWCDPETPKDHEPYVWRFSKDGPDARRKAPTNIFHETDMYTIELPGGRRDLVLEQGLSQLESAFVTLRDSKLRRHLLLEPDEFALLCVFVAATHARTKAQRDRIRGAAGLSALCLAR